MRCTVRCDALHRAVPSGVGLASVLLLGTLMAGCSSDVTRFDYPAFGLTQQNPNPTPQEPVYSGDQPSGGPVVDGNPDAPQPDYGGYSDNAGEGSHKYVYRGHVPASGGYGQSYGAQVPAAGAQAPVYGASGGQGQVYGSSAPAGFGTIKGQPESYQANGGGGQTTYVTAGATSAAGIGKAPVLGSGQAAAFTTAKPVLSGPSVKQAMLPAKIKSAVPQRPKAGSVVEVQPGETLYQVAIKNGVSVVALMQTNGLSVPIVHPGQKLLMPGKSGRSILPPTASADAPQQQSSLASPPAAAADATDTAAVDTDSSDEAPSVQKVALTTSKPAAVPLAQTAPLAAGDNANGTYTIRLGDTLYSIARKHGLKPEELASANSITDLTKIKMGQVLSIPAGHALPATGASAAFQAAPAKQAAPATKVASLQAAIGTAQASAAPATQAPAVKVKAAPVGAAPAGVDADMDGIPDSAAEGAAATADAEGIPAAPAAGTASTTALQPVVKQKAAATKPAAQTQVMAPAQSAAKSQVKTAALAPVAGALAPAASAGDPASDDAVASDGRFRWPVRGRVISRFGAPVKTGQNDGIDLAVPLGTEVHAAENGVVAYAGDELKGYGKLILIRHADNWVSAYAHNDELMVKRGDQIRRGQVIAKAGASGNIDQPMLHFELRKGSQPVDPMPHMASN